MCYADMSDSTAYILYVSDNKNIDILLKSHDHTCGGHSLFNFTI